MTDKKEGSPTIKLKLVYGIFYSAIFLAWIPFLYRMRQVRMSLEHPESGLFLSRALVFMAMAACFVLAVRCFNRSKNSLCFKKRREFCLL